MGSTYTRQSTFTDGDTITADLFNTEFDQLVAAFAATSGHSHDGTAGEGGPIGGLITPGITLGDNTIDVTLTFDGGSNDGVLKWMEDEDYFEFSDDILIASTEKLQFRDTAIYINSSADGQLDIVADTEVQIAATTIDINGAVDISGNLAVGGNLVVTGTTTFNGGTLTLGDSAADNVVFGADVNSSIIPNTDDTYDLGSASQQWRNLFIDGTAEVDVLSIAGTAVTSTAAELNLLDGVSGLVQADLTKLAAVDASATELNILDGKAFLDEDNFASNSATGIASQQSIKAYVDGVTTTSITSTGALNAGSITSGFGNIDTGASTITTTGLISGGSLDIDNVLINGTTIGHTDDTDLITLADGVVTVAGEVSMTTLDIGGTNVTSTAAELNALDGITAVVGELNALDLGSTAVGTAIASKAVVLDSNKDYTGIRNFTITGNLSVGGTTTVVDTVTMNAQNAVLFEGATADAHETTLTIVDPTADRTINLPNQSGTIPVLAAASNTAVTSTPEELNILDGVTSTAAELNILDVDNSTLGDLAEISTVANDDVFLAIDTSGGGLKRVTRSTVVSGLATSSGLSNVVEDTSPQLGGNLDTNSQNILIDDAHFIGDESGNEQLVFQTTGSAVNQLEITNAASGNGPILASTGGDTNINLNLTPKGSGVVMIDGTVGIDTGKIDLKNSGTASQILFYCESSNAHAQTLQGAPHSQAAANTLLLPDGDSGTLLSTVSTATVTNKTFTSPKINEDVAVTSTATEINLLDGVTATTAELNILDGVTSTAAELNILDGVTSTAAELNILDGVTSTAAELNILDGVTATAAEINLIDGGTARGTTAVADGDGVLINDAGTMRMTSVDTLSTYMSGKSVGGSSIVTTGALNSGSITSGFGNIDTGSSTITTTGLISGGSLDIDNVLINGTTIGHTDDTDLITVANGLVTVAGEVQMTTLDIGGTNVTSTAAELNLLDGSSANSVVNSKAVIYGSSGELAGALSTAAQTNVTSLGTLTALTVDDVAIDGKAMTMTGSSSDTAVFTVGTNGTLSIVTTDDAAAAANIQITADGTAELAGTTVTLDSGGDIDLAATNDVNLPANVGLTFGDDGEKIEGDGTNLAINSSGDLNVTATTIDIDGNVEISGTAVTTGVHTFTAVPVFPNDTVETADIQADAITGAKIADNAINSEHYTDGSIDTAHIADGQITADKLGADSVTAAKIGDNVLNSEHYAAGSIDAEHLASDSVTEAKIAANSIDSQAYVDGSIDTAHIADNQITLAKMAGIARGKLIVGDSGGNPAVIGPGNNGQVLTSDGTDIAFADAAGGPSYTRGTTVPSSPNAGDWWNNTGNDSLYIYDATDGWITNSTHTFGTGTYQVPGNYSLVFTGGINRVSFQGASVGTQEVGTQNTSTADNNTSTGDGGFGLSNSVRGVFGTTFTDKSITYLIMATSADAIDFGDLVVRRSQYPQAASHQTRGIIVGGSDNSEIDYITIATAGNALDFGDLTTAGRANIACSAMASTTRAIFKGGSGNVMDYVTVANTGNATDFGDVGADIDDRGGANVNSTTRGIMSGNNNATNTIEYITMGTAGNSTDFGDMTGTANTSVAVHSSTTAYVRAGEDVITMATAANATASGYEFRFNNTRHCVMPGWIAYNG